MDRSQKLISLFSDVEGLVSELTQFYMLTRKRKIKSAAVIIDSKLQPSSIVGAYNTTCINLTGRQSCSTTDNSDMVTWSTY
ncbi:MAG: hypothetical protein KUG78_07260 [Kangiellaceae bacterium]|nr:hypothetical protein [Kangiellaceae bacterium]